MVWLFGTHGEGGAWRGFRGGNGEGDGLLAGRDGAGGRAQFLGTEVAELEVFGTDTLELGAGALGGADGGELGDQVVLSGGVEGLELGGIGVRQVVEVEGIRDESLQLVGWRESAVARDEEQRNFHLQRLFCRDL